MKSLRQLLLRWSIAMHDIRQQIVGQSVCGAAMHADHRFSRGQSVKYCLFGSLGCRLKQRTYFVRRQHAHCRDRFAVTEMVAGREREEDVAAAVEPDAAHPSLSRRGTPRQALTLYRQSGASVARITMIEPASVGVPRGDGTASTPISRPTGTPSTRSNPRAP